MAGFRATKNQSRVDEVFQPTAQRSYDASIVYGWENENRESKATLSRYQRMIQRGDFLTSDDLTAYKNALDTYVSSAQRLRSLNKILGGSVEDDQKWTSQMQTLNSGYDSVSKYYSQWKTADDYKASQEAQKRRTAQLGMDLDAGAKEIEDMEAFYDDVFTIEAWYNAEGRVPTNPHDETYKANLEKYNKLKSQYGSVADLEKAIQDKKLYLNEAKRLQEGAVLAGVADETSEYYDPDFNAYSQQGAAVENPTIDEAIGIFAIGDWNPFGKDPANKVTYTRDNWEEFISRTAGQALNGGASPSAYQMNELYTYMTDDEVSIYNYYLAKDMESGTNDADRYLDSIEDTLEGRKAGKIYEPIQGNTFLELTFGIAAGLDQFTSGIENLGNAITGKDDYIPPSAIQIASGMVREDLADDSIPLWYNIKTGQWENKVFGNSLGQIGYDAVTTTTNMLPSILTSTVVGAINPVLGGVTGSVLLGASASGNAYQEMLNLGYDKGQARTYAALVGGSEAGLQYLLGGIGKLGGKLSGNVVSKILSGVDNALARTAIKLGGNMLSEGFEEGLQEILTPWFKNLATGVYSEDVNWSEAAYSSLLGALTAGVMEGGRTISGEVNTYKTGKALQAKDISAQRLADIGTTFAADTVAYQLAGRVNENTGAYTIGRLFNEIGAELTEANKADIARELESRGVSAKDAKIMVDAMADVVVGGEFTDKQIAMLEANDVLTKAWLDVIVNPNSTVNQRSQGYNEILSDLAKQKTSKQATPSTIQTEPVSQSGENVTAENTVPTETEMPTQSDYEAAVEGKTIRKSTGEAVSIKEVASVGNGKMTLRLEDGSEIDSKEIAYSNAGEAYVFETVANLGVDAVEATRLINAFRNSGVEGKAFADGMKLAFEYGYGNFSQQELAQKDFAGNIPQMYINTAYEIGQKMRQQEGEQNSTTQEPSEKRTAKKREVYYTTKDGKVLSMSQAEKNGKLALKDKQSVAVKTAKFLQKLGLGGNYYFFESYVDEKGNRIFKDRFGNIQSAPNGLYYSDGDIYIDINAGTDSHSITLRTLSHELTHMIQQWSAAKYKVIADFLAEQYDKEGRSAYEAAKAKQAELSVLRGKHVPFQEAYHEFVADSMSTLFDDGNMYDILTDLKKKDKTLVDYIKKFFDGLAAKVRKLYANAQAETDEGQFVQGLSKDTIYRLQQMFAEALVEASANDAASEQKNTDTQIGVQQQTRMTDADIRAVQNIGRISVNQFSPADIKATERFAQQYWREMGTKSPFFRAWFGDWRVNDQTKVQVATQKGDTRGVQKNEDTGWDIQVSGMVFNETTRHTESYNTAAKPYLPYINSIVKNAVLLDSFGLNPGKLKSHNSLLMHSLYAVADIGRGPEIIKLYVEEMNDPNAENTSKRAYQLQNVERYQPQNGSSQKTASSISSATGSIHTVADLFAAVKQMDASFQPKPASKVVNGDGTPMVVYHGTSDHFTEFKHSELSDKEGSFFFAQNREDAEAYSGTGRVMEVYVNLQNPIDYNDMPSEIYRFRYKKDQVDALRKLGYDGWMCDMDTGWGEISAFNSNQIKSATDNIGTFDGSNPDIRYQDRTAAPSNRELLAQALEGVATDVEDYHAVKEYRRIVPLLDSEEAKLSRLNAQIREMSFGKGKRDNDKLFALRLEAKQTQNRIDIYDKQLLKLEATAPLQRVLEREKAKARERAKQRAGAVRFQQDHRGSFLKRAAGGEEDRVSHRRRRCDSGGRRPLPTNVLRRRAVRLIQMTKLKNYLEYQRLFNFFRVNKLKGVQKLNCTGKLTSPGGRS